VRVHCCALCTSDLHTVSGRRPAPHPSILGHEAIGTIEALSLFPNASCAVGDRIVWSVAASCGECALCLRGLPQKCQRLYKYGHEPLTPEHPLDGGLASHCHLLPGTAIVRVPDPLPDNVACLAGCAVATVAAAFRAAGDCSGRSVLVLGAGILGLFACAMAKERDASVLCIDPEPERREMAHHFGATHTASPEDAATLVAVQTQGRGTDFALELSGNPEAVESAVSFLAIGGIGILVGSVHPTRPVALDPERIVRRLLTIRGVHNYAGEDLFTAVRFLADTFPRYPYPRLIAAEYPLEDINAAFDHAARRPIGRVVVRG
jgi:putative phosphonate catabolism associated alcohol dehydrogenase